MTERSQDWEKLNRMGELDYVDAGNDSEVSRLKTKNSDIIIKQYSSLVSRHGEEIAKEILQDYYRDTERVQEFLQNNPNPWNYTVNLDGVEYDLIYKIVPQGGMLLEGEEGSKGNDQSSPILASQSFIKGLNLVDLAHGEYDPDEQSDKQGMLAMNRDFIEELDWKSEELFDRLNEKLNVKFTYSANNIKPFFNASDNKIEVYITDLASYLDDYYLKSKNKNENRIL